MFCLKKKEVKLPLTTHQLAHYGYNIIISEQTNTGQKQIQDTNKQVELSLGHKITIIDGCWQGRR